jgi:hypothetical protein
MVIDTQTLPREVPVCPAKVRPALVYIESETIMGKRRTIGTFIDSPRSATLRFISATLTEVLVTKWLPRANHINQIETATSVAVLDTWPRLIEEADTIMFIDNNAALSCLINGSSGLTASDAGAL